MNLPFLSSKKFLIPVGTVIFFTAFLSNIPLEKFINEQIKKNVPRKCVKDLPKIKVSFFPIPRLAVKEKFNLSSSCSGMSKKLEFNELSLSSRGVSFSPLGLKFSSTIQVKRHKPIETSVSLGTSDMKLLFDKSIITSDLIKDFARIPMEIEGDIEVSLISLISYKKGIKKLDANIASSNLSLPPQMVSGFNIPNIKASPMEIDTQLSKSGNLEINAIKIGTKENDLYLMGKGDIKSFNQPNKSSINLMATLALKKELKTQFSFIDLLLGNANDMGEYKFQVSGKLLSPRVKSLN